MTRRFWPALVTDAEQQEIQRALGTDGGCDDSFVIRDNLRGLDEFERAMRAACEEFLSSDPVDPGDDGNGQ